MLVKSLLFFLGFSAMLDAQNLVPYQVQDLKNWDEHALWGYKNLDFKIIIEPINENPDLFFGGYANFKKGNKIGLIDTTGKVIIEPIYEEIANVLGDYALVKEFSNSDKFIVSIKTKKKVEYKTTNINQRIELSNVPGIFTLFSDNATYADAFGLMRSDGKIILEPKYSFIECIGDNIFSVKDTSGKTGIFSAKGNWIMKPRYKDLGFFSKGMAYFQLNNKFGFINNQGKEVIPPIYESAVGDFKNGFATLSNGKENFFLDETGKMYFKGLGFKEIIDSRNNLLTVRAKNDSLYLVSKNAIIVNERGADEIAIIDSTAFLYRIGGNLFYQSADTIIEVPIKNVTKVSALYTGYYFIESKTDSNTVLKIATNKIMESIAQIEQEGSHFGWSFSMGIIAKCFFDKQKIEDILVTYIDKTGKQFSDFKE